MNLKPAEIDVSSLGFTRSSKPRWANVLKVYGLLHRRDLHIHIYIYIHIHHTYYVHIVSVCIFETCQ